MGGMPSCSVRSSGSPLSSTLLKSSAEYACVSTVRLSRGSRVCPPSSARARRGARAEGRTPPVSERAVRGAVHGLRVRGAVHVHGVRGAWPRGRGVCGRAADGCSVQRGARRRVSPTSLR
eukprot:2322937-Prymnesium_polylepis.2